MKATSEKTKTKLGLYLEQEAQKRKISLRALSLNAGLNEAAVSQIVWGRHRADYVACMKLASYLEVDVNYLLELADRASEQKIENMFHQPPDIRNIIERLSSRSYSKKAVNLIKMILDQEEESPE